MACYDCDMGYSCCKHKKKWKKPLIIVSCIWASLIVYTFIGVGTTKMCKMLGQDAENTHESFPECGFAGLLWPIGLPIVLASELFAFPEQGEEKQ